MFITSRCVPSEPLHFWGAAHILHRAKTAPQAPLSIAAHRPQADMTAYAATRVLSLLGVGKRRPATAAFTAAAAASSGKAGPALLRAIGSSRLAPAVRQLGALHGCAVVCSAAGGANGAFVKWRS